MGFETKQIFLSLNRMTKWNDVLYLASHGSPEPNIRIVKTDDEWRKQLSEEQYYVTRRKGTEIAFTGEYCYAHEPGRYNCLCCGEPLFDASLKFDSKSGWPSFTEPIAQNAISYEKDISWGMIRVEVTCNACDAHLGHVFPDGPPPTGLRYCINSVSIVLEKNRAEK